jgi:hypothetical protein
MKTLLRKRFIWLVVLTALAVNTAMAQNHHMATPVEPGSKGNLPTLPARPAEAEEGHFGGLELDHQTMNGIILNGYYTYEGWLRFPKPTEYEADYYTLQYRQVGTDDWKTWIGSDDQPYHFEGDNACPSLDYMETEFRLKIHGGPKDGYISNVVKVTYPVVGKCRVRSYPLPSDNQLVGRPVRLTYLNVDRHDYPEYNQTKQFTVEDNCYRYSWYRRNPNTGEMTKIEGANTTEYTPTVDDLGYQVVIVVTGDDEHVSFMSTINFQLVQLPLECSVEYMDKTGFTLNSAYVLPNPSKNLLITDLDDWEMKSFADGSLTTLKPGQYTVEMDLEKYNGAELGYTDNRLKVSFVYSQPKYDDEGNPIEGEYEPWYREAQLMYDRYMVPLTVSALFNNEKVSTTFDVIGKNRLGEIGVVATVIPEKLEEGVASFEVFKGKYYVKARKTDGTMDTYYPNVQLWSEAEEIEPEPYSWEEDWKPTSVSIAMQAAPAPLTGIGVIEGTVVLNEPAAGTRGDSEAETETCKVYLKAKDAEIVAQTETDANGKFRFENVPFGDYQVLLDVEGRAMKSVQEVAVTEEAPEVAELDYVITETEIVTKEEYIAINTETASVTISAAKQLAYYSDQALDFTDKPELKAYVATGYAKSGTIWLTRVKKVPANTGFLLMGDPGEYDVPVIESDCSAYYKNLFKGTLEGATIQTTEDGYTNYYLSKGDYGVSFYKVGASGVTLGANRAYLSVPSDIPAVGTAGGTETIKVSAALQVPYYSANSLDFTDMESKGLKAYTATGYDYERGTIWLSRVKQVPAETGILIMAEEAGDYDVPKASVASVYENMFMGTLGGKTIQTEETIAGEDYINYYLSKGDYGISFYKVGASGVTLGENRCYLAVPVRKSSASGTRGFSSEADQITIQEADEVIGIPLYRGIDGDDDGTTSIREVKSGEVKSEEWYTLQGQRVQNPGKGLYIKNGRKVVIK